MRPNTCTPPYACLLQVAALSCLQALELSCVRYSAHSMADLSSLQCLTGLSLDCAAAAPATLAAMSGLRELRISGCHETEPLSGLDAQLSHLTQLTWLWLGGAYLYTLPALASLQQLEHFGIWTEEDVPMEGGDGQALPRLPDGPYLHSLRDLDLTWPLMVKSLPALRQATALTQIVLGSMPSADDTPPGTWTAFWDWAAHHPPLKALRFCLDEEWDGPFSCAMFDAVMRLRELRPALSVSRLEFTTASCH